jgi:hypothetical protein
MLRLALASFVVALAATASDQSSRVTFTKDVLPILQKNCQSCHRPRRATIGPGRFTLGHGPLKIFPLQWRIWSRITRASRCSCGNT